MKTPSQNSAHKFLKFFLISSLVLPAVSYSETQTIKLSSVLPNIEVADNYSSRRRGLMFRSSLQSNTGMLFIWKDYTTRCMWMKNTSLPLSVAYLSNDGVIKEIYNMVPFSEESVCSANSTRIALEVNAGWFKENGIAAGDKLDF